MPIIKKSVNNKCWQGYGEKGQLYSIGGNVNWYSHCGTQYGAFSKQLKIELPLINQFHYWMYIQKQWKLLWKDTCTPASTAVLFAIAKRWKKPVSMNTWANKEDKDIGSYRVLLSYRVYSAIQRMKSCHLQ